MALIKLESPALPVWEDGRPTGEKKTTEAFINPQMVASITLYKGTNLHEGWLCSKVLINTGSCTETYYDVRLPNLLTEIINHECGKD